MEYKMVHDLNIVDMKEMERIQNELRKRIKIKKLEKKPRFIGGMDIAYYTEESTGKEKAISVIVVIDINTNEILDKVYTVLDVEEKSKELVYTIEDVVNPYIPGYFGFREIPSFINTWEKLKTKPDIMVFDGQGMLHPNRMGLATQSSFFIDIPTIGVGKSFFHFNDVYFQQPENKEGAYSYIKEKDEILGVAYRSHKDVKPIFISIGNFITLEESIEIVGKMITKISRVPTATRVADLVTKELRRNMLNK